MILVIIVIVIVFYGMDLSEDLAHMERGIRVRSDVVWTLVWLYWTRALAPER